MRNSVAGSSEHRWGSADAFFVAMVVAGIVGVGVGFGTAWSLALLFVGLAGILFRSFPAGSRWRWLSAAPLMVALVVFAVAMFEGDDRDNREQELQSRVTTMEGIIDFCESERRLVSSLRIQETKKHVKNAQAAINAGDLDIAEGEIEEAENYLGVGHCLR